MNVLRFRNFGDRAGTKGHRAVQRCVRSPWHRWSEPSAAATERSTERRSSGTHITTRYQSHDLGQWVQCSCIWAYLSSFLNRSVFTFSFLFSHSVWLTRPGTWASIHLCTCRIKCLTSSRTTSWWTAWSAVLPCCWNAACATRRLPCTRSKAWSGHTMCCSSGQVAHISQQRLNTHLCGLYYHWLLLSSQPCRRRETP